MVAVKPVLRGSTFGRDRGEIRPKMRKSTRRSQRDKHCPAEEAELTPTNPRQRSGYYVGLGGGVNGSDDQCKRRCPQCMASVVDEAGSTELFRTTKFTRTVQVQYSTYPHMDIA